MNFKKKILLLWVIFALLDPDPLTRLNQDPQPWCIPVLQIRDVYPRSRILMFIHAGSRIQKHQQKRGVKKMCCGFFVASHKYHKIENYFIFELVEKKIWANLQRVIEFFTQKWPCTEYASTLH
jgi:hypothetical protein